MTRAEGIEDVLEELLLIFADLDLEDNDEIELRDFLPRPNDPRLKGLETKLTVGELRRRIRSLRAV